MKLFLDDIREPPDGTWMLCRQASEFCHLARHTKDGDILSLDHDLGLNQPTGYEIMKYFEKEVVLSGLWSFRGAPKIIFHSANPVGVENMKRVLTSIRSYFS